MEAPWDGVLGGVGGPFWASTSEVEPTTATVIASALSVVISPLLVTASPIWHTAEAVRASSVPKPKPQRPGSFPVFLLLKKKKFG
jgi:hypothetical protein